MSKYHNSPFQNSPGETTWRLWATSSYTSSVGLCPGRGSGPRPRLRNTRKSARRNSPHRWRSFAKALQVSSTFLPGDDGGKKNSAFQAKQSERERERDDLFTEKRPVRQSESELSLLFLIKAQDLNDDPAPVSQRKSSPSQLFLSLLFPQSKIYFYGNSNHHIRPCHRRKGRPTDCN